MAVDVGDVVQSVGVVSEHLAVRGHQRTERRSLSIELQLRLKGL